MEWQIDTNPNRIPSLFDADVVLTGAIYYDIVSINLTLLIMFMLCELLNSKAFNLKANFNSLETTFAIYFGDTDELYCISSRSKSQGICIIINYQ